MIISNKLIKNDTPYVGRIDLRFVKKPNNTDPYSVMNKIHFDLGFTKLISRVVPNRDEDNNFVVDLNKIRLIERYTMGFIKTYRFKNTSEYIKNSFVSLNNQYIGNLMTGWKFYKERLIVTNECPTGVAVKLKKSTRTNLTLSVNSKKYEMFLDEQIEKNNVEGVVAFNRTCWGNPNDKCVYILKIGDRIFDMDYVPIETDYEEWEWAGYVLKCNEMGLDVNQIADVIPYTQFGSKVIENWTGALVSAINLSKYIN